jgi:hypothetical protein
MDTQQIQSFAKDSKTLNEFVQKLGYKCYGSTVKKLIVEHNVDVSHLNISHKYIDQFTDEQFTKIVENAKFWKDAMYECGYNSYKGVPHIKKRAVELGLNTKHILGEEWAKTVYSGTPTYTLEQICIENSFYGNCQQLMRRLKRELGWEHKCTSCENTTWTIKGETYPLPLELEHINGNHFDHRLENLTFLCPNCHTFTPTYKGKNLNRGKKGPVPEGTLENIVIKKKEASTSKEPNKCLDCHCAIKRASLRCCDCNKKKVKDNNKPHCEHPIEETSYTAVDKKQAVEKEETKDKKMEASTSKESNKCLDCHCDIRREAIRCIDCHKKKIKDNNRPSCEQLIKEIEETSYIAVGKKYGVSDNAIRKWIKAYGNVPPKKHKDKTDKS